MRKWQNEKNDIVIRQGLDFPEEYFEDEVREGFLVECKMKCAWAAQLEVLKEIDRICTKHGIRYFADSGTLLGAVRHKGYIPWDDDVDIAMLRDDYQRFLAIAPGELERGEWKILDLEEGFRELFCRVVNSTIYNSGKERLLRFHGCPYVVGVDIFPLDYVPIDKAEEEVWYLLAKSLHSLLRNVMTLGEELVIKEMGADLQKLEEICRIKLREKNLEKQLRILLNEVIQMYAGEKAEELEYIVYDLRNEGKRCKYQRDWYEGSRRIPFENIMIPVPNGYDGILRALYGDDYMVPKRELAHDYPFYKKQDLELAKMKKCKI